MKAFKILSIAFIFTFFTFTNLRADNKEEKKFPPLTNTHWIYRGEWERGRCAIIIIFSSDSTCSVHMEGLNKRGEFIEIGKVQNKYHYNYPEIIFYNATYYDMTNNRHVILKGIRNKNEIEIFREDETSFIMTKWTHKK